MSTTIRERDIELTFQEPWVAVKYDQSPEYLDGIGKLSGIWKIDRNGKVYARGTKAIDILAQRSGKLTLIEIKDFRKDPTNSDRRIQDHLPLEVGFKVCDTVAGLVGLYRQDRPKSPVEFSSFGKVLTGRGEDVEVCLWLEETAPASQAEEKRRKQRLSVVTKKLETYCRWFTEFVLVVHSRQYQGALPGVIAEV